MAEAFRVTEHAKMFASAAHRKRREAGRTAGRNTGQLSGRKNSILTQSLDQSRRGSLVVPSARYCREVASSLRMSVNDDYASPGSESLRKPIAQFLKERTYGCRSIVDQCQVARYGVEGMKISDPSHNGTRVHRGQKIIDQIMADLDPPSPIRQSELAVQMKMPKRVTVASRQVKSKVSRLPTLAKARRDPKFEGTNLNEAKFRAMVGERLHQLNYKADP